MIKRTESKSASRKINKTAKRRRLRMEGLEERRLLAAGPHGVPDVDVPLFNEARNIGVVNAFPFVETEVAGAFGQNDDIQNATFIPLGTRGSAAGEEDTIDITGSMGFTVDTQGNFIVDVDVFSFDLRAGDVLDVALQGAAGNISILFEDGSFWFGTDTNQGILHPQSSPLQTQGTAVAAQVVPEDGRYHLFMAPSNALTSYTAGLRVYRPVTESLPIGVGQYLYLDFDGGVFPTSLFPATQLPPGVIRASGLRDNLGLLGLPPVVSDATFNEIIDKTIAQVESDFQSVVTNGRNGDYFNSGVPGEYGITILNSRDHEDPGFNNPLVTRMLIGHTIAEIGIDGILGIAQSLDIGNFDLSENGLVPIDFFVAQATQFPLSPAVSVLDAVSHALGTTISHEFGHVFGLRHNNGDNFTCDLMDDPGVNRNACLMGVGPDLIFGTEDDTIPQFMTDQFSLNEGMLGTHFTADNLAFGLSTGLLGGSVAGRVFNDLNGDGLGNADAGLPGVTVFLDLDGNGVQNGPEPVTTTGSDGSYVLTSGPGTFNVIALTPDQFAPTTATTVAATIAVDGSTTGVNFGFNQVVSDITGTKWADLDGDGLFDPGEPGIEGVFIYLDLDGDDRPDLGEPNDTTAADGTYSLNFPGPGTYTIREVITPGFVQTFPDPATTGGEHTVVFNGIALTENFNFGNLPSRDFGDAPDSYQTTIASDGPSHGLTAGLTIGANIDRDLDGQPSALADGDDDNGRLNVIDGTVIDDEDGVRLLSPLGPGDTAEFEVTLTNTSGSTAFLQAWLDFDRDGVFESNEQFATDVSLGTGVHTIPVTLPGTVTPGTTYARFRYSQTAGLGVGGSADTGEVEDYSFPILDAARVANNDEFSVSRNTQANQFDLLANDFETVDNQLTIIGRDLSGTAGTVVIAQDGRSVFYTPPTGFVGRDAFGYTVRDDFGRESTATVIVNVTFQSAVPIALDDSFTVPEGTSNFPLNVLDNDVPSIAGGLSITSVTAGSQGGTINVIGGGQSIRYTPIPGFNGTEQFTYSVQDAAGSVSSAQVTVNLLPGSINDDVIDYSIGIFDVLNDRELENVQVGDIFNVRIFVEHLNPAIGNPEGIAAAFLDLLYTDELVATRDSGFSPLGFDVTFGPIFGGFNTGNAAIPGLLDDIGSVQSALNPANQIEHGGPVELLTVTMQAVSPGVAIFQADPPDNTVSDTTVIASDERLMPSEMRLGNAQLIILPTSDNFATAIDDSFPEGRDSDGNIIVGNASTPARLDVLSNDLFGPTNSLDEFGILTSPSLGNATINSNGTADPSDDVIEYVADVNANGFDTFTYFIRSADGIRSTAEVTLAIGNAGGDDVVGIDFALVDTAGNAISSVAVGERFGVQVIVEDLRIGLDETFVFAAHLDVLYSSGLIAPANTNTADDLDFDVEFDSDFNPLAAVGTASRPGVIDEFGTLLVQALAEAENVDNPNLMATLFFEATAAGTATVVGGPADRLPDQDTLLFGVDDPVPVDQIRYDSLTINVTGPESELHNAAMPEDVNNDNRVTAVDALVVLNQLNRSQLGASAEQVAPKYYVDVTGEGDVSARDALAVINYMNTNRIARQVAEAEAVAGVILDDGSTNQDQEDSVDQAVVATLNESSLLGDSSGSGNVGSSQSFIDSSTAGSDAEEEEDILDLLANDVSAQWS